MLLIVQVSSSVYCQTVDDLYKYYQHIASKYLVKSKQVENFFSIDARGIAMYASAADKKKNTPECLIYWDEIETYKNLVRSKDKKEQLEYYESKKDKRFSLSEKKRLTTTQLPPQASFGKASGKKLQGYKIAIDPGHIAGTLDIAKVEHRFIEMEIKGKKVSFFEGDLTLRTALILKEKLEKQGATVFLTRSRPNTTAYGNSFKHWRKTYLPEILDNALARKRMSKWERNRLLFRAKDTEIFHDYFLPRDLEMRASLINAFNPDITIVIHFNAAPQKERWNMAVKENYNMVFMPGAFLSDDLSNPTERLEFLNLLILANFDKSAKLAGHLIKEFIQQLDVPPIPVNNKISYLQKISNLVSEGVYCRNLKLCRQINSPLCYGESLYQDNEQEALRLFENKERRIKQVAEAYYNAVLKYFQVVK
ncbi:N-acetylmuramoyl-L-alanine amidase family protein [Thermoflexibacter ruber]|uniref:N-acetylmuramoyl-L-alanine amidase n=1 Tax=Thermoflexibacter ruber TaxID=1003 RepID=A0A1I2ETL3_9BACT|nr:N-acetylmuramoyl-L-alanine amidase [Thermoflexibacter ruber]SFE95796.1 N-acetylmuramoyl-L-alanine amidase [Thermoflexibacter ruber]